MSVCLFPAECAPISTLDGKGYVLDQFRLSCGKTSLNFCFAAKTVRESPKMAGLVRKVPLAAPIDEMKQHIQFIESIGFVEIEK